MKKLPIYLLLLLTPLLILGCTADSDNAPVAEGAAPVIVERPTQVPETPTQTPTEAPKPIDLPPEFCPVTQQPAKVFIPPEPFRQEPYPDQFFYGTNELWTALPTNYTWLNLSYDEEGGYGQKLFFQREGYFWMDEPEPDLTVNGRKIDPESTEEQSMITTRPTNGFTPEDGSFMLMGGEFPTTGCWEITAQYGDDQLTYTIWVGTLPE